MCGLREISQAEECVLSGPVCTVQLLSQAVVHCQKASAALKVSVCVHLWVGVCVVRTCVFPTVDPLSESISCYQGRFVYGPVCTVQLLSQAVVHCPKASAVLKVRVWGGLHDGMCVHTF